MGSEQIETGRVDEEYGLNLSLEELVALYYSNSYAIYSFDNTIKSLKEILAWDSNYKESENITDQELIEEINYQKEALQKITKIQEKIEDLILFITQDQGFLDHIRDKAQENGTSQKNQE